MSSLYPNTIPTQQLSSSGGGILLAGHESSSLKNDDLPKAHTASRTFQRNIDSEGIVREQIIHDPDHKQRQVDLKKSIRNPLFHDFKYVERRQKSQPEFISSSQPLFRPLHTVEPLQPESNPQLSSSIIGSGIHPKSTMGGKVSSVGIFSSVPKDSLDTHLRNSMQSSHPLQSIDSGKRSVQNYYDLTSVYDNKGLTYIVPPERRHNTAFQYPYPVQSSPKVPVSNQAHDLIQMKMKKLQPAADPYTDSQNFKSTAKKYFGGLQDIKQNPGSTNIQQAYKQNDLETKIVNNNGNGKQQQQQELPREKVGLPQQRESTTPLPRYNNNNIPQQREITPQQRQGSYNYNNNSHSITNDNQAYLNNNYNQNNYSQQAIQTQLQQSVPYNTNNKLENYYLPSHQNYADTHTGYVPKEHAVHRQSKSQQHTVGAHYPQDSGVSAQNPSNQHYLQDYYNYNQQQQQQQHTQQPQQQYSSSNYFEPGSSDKRTWKPLNPITQKRHYQYEPKFDYPQWKWDQYDRDQFGRWQDNRNTYNSIVKQKNVRQKRKENLQTAYKEYGL